MTAVPLHRNRDFLLLQSAALVSSAGSQMTALAYSLLVLALTGSPTKAGVAAFARLLGMALCALPAGLAADRWSRKRLMIAAHALRGLAVGTLGALIVLEEIAFSVVPLVAFVEGSGAAVFSAAQVGALRAVVSRRQLPAAVAAVTGREAAISLGAPPVGGVLFGLSRALPFAADAVSYAFSTLALLAMRTPFEEQRDRDRSPLRARLGDGLRFLWHHRFLRACAFLYAPTNFIGPGVLLAVVVIGKKHGLSGGKVGLLLSAFGACLLLGAFLSPLVRRLLPVRGILLLELWTWVGCGFFLAWPNPYVLTASILPTGLAIPSTDSAVRSLQLAMTPDRLLGRVESVRTTIALLIAPLGPLTAGLLLGKVSERATIAVFAAVGLALALWGTVSPSIRGAPSLDELHDLAEDTPALSAEPPEVLASPGSTARGNRRASSLASRQSPETERKAMKLDEIEGIGPAYAEKLGTHGLTSVDDLLEHGGTAAGRQTLAEKSGISETLLLEWVNHADLFRINGVGSEYADLLEEAGVDSVPELAQRNAANLAAAMAQVNESKNLVRRAPTESEVAGWIDHAKTLPRAVHH